MENTQIGQMVLSMAQKAHGATFEISQLSSKVKDNVLLKMADALERDCDEITTANKQDVQKAEENGLNKALLDRLILNQPRIQAMAKSLREVAGQEDPVGMIDKVRRRPNGLLIGKKRVPIGVIGIIYESRPNVTSDAAGLCLKAGNCCILRGGSEAIHSNLAIGRTLKDVIKKEGLPDGVIQVVEVTDRQAIFELIRLYEYIDMIIPRGGEGLIKSVTENSLVPVVAHYKGVCHVYVDISADISMAEQICYNAKVQRPGVCNAMETLLVHKGIAPAFLPVIAKRYKEAKVLMKGCSKTLKIIPDAIVATEEDWHAEYLDLIIAIRIVDDLNQAIEHINHYGSHHSDAIVTSDYQRAMDFLDRVDSAAVYVNASTRFTDGGEFGLGAEMGISTQKLHSRGPMGVEDLTTIKYIILGNGQIRE